MKSLILSLSLILIFSNSFGQVPNDDCSTATNLGTLSMVWNAICPDGTNDYSVAIAENNNLALPSSPYYSMSGCGGYTGSTTISADDVWFKFKNQMHHIQLHMPHNDTVHINLYYGTDCNSLQPIGCWTSDYNIPFYNDFYCSNDTLNEWNYIQVSGIAPGRKVFFGLCIRADGLVPPPAYGTININTALDFASLKSQRITPNPFSSGLNMDNFRVGTPFELIDIYGKCIFSDYIHSETENINLEFLRNGIYLIRMGENHNEQLFKLIKTD